MKMTRRQAIKLFKNEVFPNWNKETETTVRCTFNDWTENLSRDGHITEKQRQTWCWDGGRS
jgi:hypothetical protein